MFLIILLLFVFVISFVIKFLNFKKIVRLIDNQNVAICGLRGTGKDMLMANYCAYTRVSDSYISNMDYVIKNKRFIPLVVSSFDTKNDFSNFIDYNLNYYKYPYDDNVPILISDTQLYFPSAYESELKKKYKGIVNYFPLSRHLGNNQICCNTQNWSMCWDKIRNQCDKYILCMSCRVIFHKFVFMRVREYEKQDSFISRVPPYKAPIKLLGKKKIDINLHKISYMASYGDIKSYSLFFVNRSKYNTRQLKYDLEKGKSLGETI